MSSTVLVTGGCGFIGTNLVNYLVGLEWRVVVLDNQSAAIWENASSIPGLGSSANVELVSGDIRDKAAIDRAMNGVDAVVHLAAQTNVVDSLKDPETVWEINTTGTLNLLEACRRRGVGGFVVASSNAAVGDQTPPIDENKVPRPMSPYGASKLAAEALCSTYYHSFDVPAVALRFANCYGPNSAQKTSVIAKFLGLIRRGEPLPVYGDGSQTRDFVHTDDICQAIHLALTVNGDTTPKGQGLGGEVFQVGSGVETSISQLLDTLNTVTGNDLQTDYRPARQGEIDQNFSDISRARKILGFAPRVALEEGLARLWNSG